MNSIDFDFDHAMCTYLGGAPESGAIQIGLRDDRLNAEYGPDAEQIKSALDNILDVALDRARSSDHTIYQLLTTQLPSVAITTREKIAAHVIYHIEH